LWQKSVVEGTHLLHRNVQKQNDPQQNFTMSRHRFPSKANFLVSFAAKDNTPALKLSMDRHGPKCPESRRAAGGNFPARIRHFGRCPRNRPAV
jgi:hypothetical protein